MNYAPRNRVWYVAAIATPCVETGAVRDHVRVTALGEDAEIISMILAAQGRVEKFTGRLLTRRTVTLKLPGLPSGACAVELPGGEVGTLTSFTVDGVALTGVQAFGDSPAVALPAAEWPSVTGTVYPVTVIYQAGFAACPPDLVQAVKLLVGDFYSWRSNAEEGTISEVPMSAKALMDPWRIRPI